MEPLVSILVPAYNAQQWIAGTLESALAQTWPRKEIIIVDDGSRDQTLLVARRFASKMVSVVSQDNQGASGARNKALSLCQGDYIQWLDADDLLAPDKIAKQMKEAEECQSKRTLFSSGCGYFYYRFNRAEFTPTALWCDLSPVESLIRKMAQNLHMQTATWLVSRELTQAAGPWDIRLLRDNDGEYFCRVILASHNIRFIPAAKSYYRRTGSSSVSYIGQSAKKLESLFVSMRLHVSYLRSLEDSPRTRDACLNYLQTWSRCFYPERLDIINQLEQLAATLGGQLEVPRLSWRYAWIQKLFGWRLAKKVQLIVRERMEDLLRCWDKGLFFLENLNHVKNRTT